MVFEYQIYFICVFIWVNFINWLLDDTPICLCLRLFHFLWFKLKLNLYTNTDVREYWIVDPYKERIFVYSLEQNHFEVETYTFHDRIPVGIYADLQIDFASLDL